VPRAAALPVPQLMFSAGLLALAAAQGKTSQPPSFEIASVKPGGDIFSTRPERSAGRIRWTTQLSYLIGYAYRLDFSKVTCPNCASVYSLEATLDPASTDDQVRLMVRSLLTDRFRMRAHQTKSEADGYALSVAKGGPKVKEAKPAEEFVEGYVSATMPGAGIMMVTGRHASISQLAASLQRFTRVPVWDRTALSGFYDFTFRYAQDLGSDVQTDAPSHPTALQENLGLKLEKRKGLVESLIVDHIEEPAGN
jgi:uncharacterized protein (TIGR03435 family)